jgi:uncharacterized 2Fe-2S/4Fe-4S cluster protein (DUF4445 family)
MSDKTRISKKFLETLPKEVATKIQDLQLDYPGIKSLVAQEVSVSHSFYVGEGDRFIGMKGEKTNDFQVVSNDTLGAANVSHKIGSSFNMPNDSFLIHISYYGRYWMTLYHIVYNPKEN